MLTDYQRDWLPKEMEPLIKLSKKKRLYIVRTIYLAGCRGGLAGQIERTSHYIRRRSAIDKIEYWMNVSYLDDIIYLALDVYLNGVRSSDDSVVIIDRRDEQ